MQNNLKITPDEPVVTVDNLEVAQFIYFILINKKILNVNKIVADKAVVIFGRFTKQRKEVLDTIADKLRAIDLIPIIIDFQKFGRAEKMGSNLG